MGLLDIFKPAWQNKDTEKAIKAVSKLKTQNEIIQVLHEATSRIVHIVAANKLSDPSVIERKEYIALCIDSMYTPYSELAAKLTDEQTIVEILCKSKSDPLHLLDKIEDQQLLFRIAKESSGSHAITAAERIEDPITAAKVKLFAANDSLRSALELRNDDAKLFYVKHANPNSSLSMAKTMVVGKEKAYMYIARSDFDIEIRIEAASELGDKLLLNELQRTRLRKKFTLSPSSAMEMIPTITDQELLAEIACCSWNGRVTWNGPVEMQKVLDEIQKARDAATAKITDQAMLKKVALNCKSTSAISRITNHDMLEQVAMRVNMNVDTLKKLPREALLRIAENRGFNALDAALLLKDQKLVWRNLPKDYRQMSEIIRQHITDQALLADYVKSYLHLLDSNYHGEHQLEPINAALENITEQVVLADVAQNAKDPDIRLCAAMRLEDSALAQEIYADVALYFVNRFMAGDAKGYRAGKKAVELLTDVTLLTKVYIYADREEIQKAALQKRNTIYSSKKL